MKVSCIAWLEKPLVKQKVSGLQLPVREAKGRLLDKPGLNIGCVVREGNPEFNCHCLKHLLTVLKHNI